MTTDTVTYNNQQGYSWTMANNVDKSFIVKVW